MKKIFTIAVATMIAATSFAQKGSMFVYGNVGLNSTKSPSEFKSNSFELTPGIGYNLNKDWSIGLAFDVKSAKGTTGAGVDVTKSSTFAFGPFLRYTKNLSSTFSLYGQFSAMFGTDKDGVTVESKTTTMNLGVIPAVMVHVSKAVAINLSFGGLTYGTFKGDYSGAKTASSFDFNFGKNTMIGLQFNL